MGFSSKVAPIETVGVRQEKGQTPCCCTVAKMFGYLLLLICVFIIMTTFGVLTILIIKVIGNYEIDYTKAVVWCYSLPVGCLEFYIARCCYTCWKKECSLDSN